MLSLERGIDPMRRLVLAARCLIFALGARDGAA